MDEHTKGPWTLDCRERHSPTLATDGYHTIDAGDRINSPEHGYVGFSIAGFMSDADARLIAAAPDLLAALEEMTCEYRYELGNEHQKIAWKKARAAIHLAKHGAPSTNEEGM